MSIRESFVAHFGADQADLIEEAALGHLSANYPDGLAPLLETVETLLGAEVPLGQRRWGSDSFKFLFIAAIGYQCMEVPGYREFHRITVPFNEVQAWSREHAHLDTFDGQHPDPLALSIGAYANWMPTRS